MKSWKVQEIPKAQREKGYGGRKVQEIPGAQRQKGYGGRKG